MKRLEDIPKKSIYTVPDGYFDRLPQVVQARVAETKSSGTFSFQWGLALRLAIPVVLLAVIGLFWWQRPESIEEQLGDIDAEQIAYFIEDADFTSEELSETVTWSTDDINELEESVYTTLETSDDWGNWLDEVDATVENF